MYMESTERYYYKGNKMKLIDKINFIIENSMEQILAMEAPIRMQENASGSVLSRAALIQYTNFTF